MRYFGYIDGGTGSFVIQAVIGTALGVAYVVRNRLRILGGKVRKAKSESPDQD